MPEDRIGQLQGERWHFSHRSIEENLTKAIQLRPAGGAPTATSAASRASRSFTFAKVMSLEFGRRMIWRTGFRDGMPGIIEALFQPFALFCARVMHWELQQGDKIKQRYEALERELTETR